MKKLLGAILFLVLIAVAGVTIYIYTIDWNKHKSIISQQFFEATGKKIVFEGPVSFEIIPSPYLKATSVKIYNPQITDKPLVEASDLVAKLALLPLVKGQFNVQRMELNNAQINFEMLENGKLNWQSDLSAAQKKNIEEAKIALNSVSLSNATVNFEDIQRDTKLKLENLNGEVMAQSIMGPFRFEGNYTKDNNPEGFAVSMGKLSDSMSTTINLVVTHPISESYVRFDGSFMLNNKVLNGNLIVESKKLRPFIAANFKNFDLPPYFDYPLALTSDIDFNEKQVSFSNVVIRYGDTQGAGNVRLPFNDGFGNEGERPRMELAFDFTDLNLDPVAEIVKGFFTKYKDQEKSYNPNMGFDLLADVKSVRTTYNNQQIKNFSASADVVNNEITLNNLMADVPGGATLSFKGTLKSNEGEPFYQFDASIKANEILKTLKWLDVAPQVTTASTYRKAEAFVTMMGTFKKIQISPFSLLIDKSSFEGEAAIKAGERKDILLKVNADMINFDNYIAGLSVEDLKKTWIDRMKMRFAKLGWLNDFDMQIDAKMDLGIYESTPFENVEFKANLLDGKLDIERLNIGSTANSEILLSGLVSGFGDNLNFNEVGYEIVTKDVASLIEKTGISVPNWDYKKLHDFSVQGVVNGNLQQYATNMNFRLENLDVAYKGQVDNSSDNIVLNGDIEIKYPDFNKMLDTFNASYHPQANNMGEFDLKSLIEGDIKKFALKDAEINIGTNNFKGNIDVDKQLSDRLSIVANLNINKFEIDRFLNKDVSSLSPQLAVKVNDAGSFWAKPEWSKIAFNYDFYQKFNLKGVFDIEELGYNRQRFSNSTIDMTLDNGTMLVNSFKAIHWGGNLEATAKLQMSDNPTLSGTLKLENGNVDQLEIGGKTYAVNGGTANLNIEFLGSAVSENDFFSGLRGNIDAEIKNYSWKGINLSAIYDDIVKRETNDGLAAFVQKNLALGVTSFDVLNSKINITDGKFVLQKFETETKNIKLSASGDGNIGDWMMNVLFKVKYAEPVYLPGFAFTLKGNIDSPVLEVDTKDLFDLYQMRNDKKEAAKKAEEDRRQLQIQNRRDEYKKISDALIDYVQNTLEPEVLKAQKTAISNESATLYAEILNQISSTISELTQATLKVSSANVSNEDLDMLQKTNQKQAALVEELRKKMEATILNDAKKEVKDLYSKMMEYYDKSKVSATKYREIKEKENSRLTQIITEYKPAEDSNIVGWQNNIEAKIAEFEKQDIKFLDKINIINASSKIEEVENYKQDILKLSDVLAANLKTLEQNIFEYSDYFIKKVDAQEQLYADKLRKEEVERKVEENTGYISIKKSGKRVTVTRDIDDIERAEELTADEEVKVLDFSKPKESINEEKPKNKVNVVKRRRQKIN